MFMDEVTMNLRIQRKLWNLSSLSPHHPFSQPRVKHPKSISPFISDNNCNNSSTEMCIFPWCFRQQQQYGFLSVPVARYTQPVSRPLPAHPLLPHTHTQSFLAKRPSLQDNPSEVRPLSFCADSFVLCFALALRVLCNAYVKSGPINFLPKKREHDHSAPNGDFYESHNFTQDMVNNNFYLLPFKNIRSYEIQG